MHAQRVGHEDAHASWSMNKFTFLHNCFSCGYKGTLTQLLLDLTGEAPDNLEADIARSNFLGKMSTFHRSHEPKEAQEPDLTDWALENLMRDVPDKLLALRHLSRSAADAFGIRWDTTKKFWVLPIRTPEGELMGAQYRQKGNVLTLPKGMEKSTTLFSP